MDLKITLQNIYRKMIFVTIAQFLHFQLGVNGYSFAVNNNGYVLYHPDLRPMVCNSAFIMSEVLCENFQCAKINITLQIIYFNVSVSLYNLWLKPSKIVFIHKWIIFLKQGFWKSILYDNNNLSHGKNMHESMCILNAIYYQRWQHFKILLQ